MVRPIDATHLGSRKEAKAENHRYYHGGMPCRLGHASPRYTSTGECVQCVNKKQRLRYTENPDAMRAYQRNRRAEKRDHVRDMERQAVERDPDRYRQYDRNRYQRDKPKRVALAKAWHEKNPAKARRAKLEWYARNPWSRRRNRDTSVERVNGSVPSWLTDEQWKRIYSMYEEAQRLSQDGETRYEVDHIHPLTAEAFCGLHVPWNLQVIPRSKNRRKGNSLPEELTFARWGSNRKD